MAKGSNPFISNLSIQYLRIFLLIVPVSSRAQTRLHSTRLEKEQETTPPPRLNKHPALTGFFPVIVSKTSKQPVIPTHQGLRRAVSVIGKC
jgi:hypothetical protein